MIRDTDCLVPFENDATRDLAARGWSLDIIDTELWRTTIDGWIPLRRYAARVRRRQGIVTHGTTADGDTIEEAVAAIVRRVAWLAEAHEVFRDLP